MERRLTAVLAASILMTSTLAAQGAPASTDADPFLWLEEVSGERALAWVRSSPANAGLAAALLLVLGYAFVSLWLPFG